jgi:hypothetical protein
MNDFRTRDPAYHPDAHIKYYLPYAEKYLDTYKIPVDKHAGLVERWREQANFHRRLANEAVSANPNNVYFLDRQARISEGLAKAFADVADDRAKSHKKFASMMEGPQSSPHHSSGLYGGSRRRNKKSKNSKKRSNKARKTKSKRH